MTLKAILTEEEYQATDESLRDHYKAVQDGSYVLDIEGAHPATARLEGTLERWKKATGSSDPRTVENRLREAKDLKEKLGDLSLDDARAAIDRLREIEEGGGADQKAELQRVREAAEKKYKEIYEPQVQTLAQERDRYKAGVEHLTIHHAIDEVLSAIDEHGEPVILPGTAVKRAVKLLILESEHRVIEGEDGRPKGVFVSDLGEEVPADTFVQAWLKSDEAKSFRPASGNNGTGSRETKGGGGAGKNPWKKGDSFSLTEQGRILRETPALAKQLAAQAGVKLTAA